MHGETQDEALAQVNVLAQEWIVLAKNKNWQIPEPKGRLVFA